LNREGGSGGEEEKRERFHKASYELIVDLLTVSSTLGS
jgi:hypothetical protein